MVRVSEDVLYVVMPAYNEEKNIEQVVLSWMDVLKFGARDSRLVVADSGSTDSTHDILLSLKKKYKQIEILENTDKQHGPKVIALYKHAVENGADFIFQTDSDGQTSPKEFKKFWEKKIFYDGLIGARKTRGDGKGRAFVERVVCFLLRMFFGVKVPDANAPFRLMRRSLIEKYLSRIPEDYSLPNIILTAYFVKNKEKIKFEEISFAPRVAGNNSINLKKIIMIGARSLIDFHHFRRDMLNTDGRTMKISRPKKLTIIGVFVFIASLLVMISPAFPWNGGMEMTDSSVFLTIGRQMKTGAVPYVNTFDHKGPMLYIVNFLGVVINETNGIFILEFLAILLTLWFMFKLFCLKNSENIWFSMVMTILLFTPFINLYLSDAGNLSEQYALPFIAFSLYAFVKYFLNGKLSGSMTFWVGVSFSCVIMMRINMVGLWVIFCLAVFCKCIGKRKYRDLGRYVLWFLIGVICVVGPILIWLISSNAFDSFVSSYLLFNMNYLDNKVDGIKSTMLFFLQDIVITISMCLSIWEIFSRSSKKEKNLRIWYFISFIFCFFLVCMSGRIYPHYGMVLAPFTIFPFAILCNEIGKEKNRSSLLGLVFIIVLALVYKSWLDVASRAIGALERRMQNAEKIKLVDEICENIEKYTNISDRITVYGNWNYVYLKCNRLPASKYSYQIPIGEVEPKYMEEYYEEIRVNKTKIFIVQEHMMNDALQKFLASNRYVEKWSKDSDGARIYVMQESI